MAIGPSKGGVGTHALMRLALAGLLMVLTSCGGGGGRGDDREAEPADVGPGTWVVLGSSSAAGTGVGAGTGAAWVDLLAEQLKPHGVVIRNLARPGLRSSQALPAGTPLPAGYAPPDPTANIDRATASHPTLVVLAFPTNDAVAGIKAAETVSYWQMIRDRAAQAGSPTLVVGTQPRDGLDAKQRATLDESDRLAARAFGGCYVPVRAALSDTWGHIAAPLSAGDGIHLNDAGHRVVFDRVAAALASGRCVRLVR